MTVEDAHERQVIAEHLFDLHNADAPRQSVAETLPGLGIFQFTTVIPDAELVAILNLVGTTDINIGGGAIDIYDLWL